MKKSARSRIGHSSISMKCRVCNSIVNNVDSDSKSVLCYKCVAKTLNPNTKFYEDFTEDELKNLIKSLPSSSDPIAELLDSD